MESLIYAQKHTLNLDILDKLSTPTTVTRDLEFYIEADAKVKVAVIECSYYDSIVPTRQVLDRIIDISNAVVFKSVEGYGTIINLMHDYDLPNMYYFIGFVPNFELKQATWEFDSYWLGNTVSNYTEGYDSYITDSRYNNSADKPYKFDVLYGQSKAHRTFTRDYLKDDLRFLQAPFLKSSSCYHDCMDDRDNIFWEDDIKPRQDGRVDFMGKTMNLSQTIPFKVYNESLYSLVCETWTDNEYSFYTEKIAKPMVVGRLFIPVTGQYFLHNMRGLGFRTFHGIIDESFDEISDHKTRWAAAIEEAKKLCDKDPVDVLNKARPIIGYNRNKLLNFKHNFFKLEGFVKKVVNEKLGL